MQSSASKATRQRRLYLVRHAKAVEEDGAGDHSRPLSSRGVGDAAALGQWLTSNAGLPELVLCSTAKRTRETLTGLGETIPTILSDKIYLASACDLLARIQECDDEVQSLMVIGHNPGMHGLLALLVGEYKNDADADKMILKFPTSACAVLTLPVALWRDVTPQSAILETLRY